MTSATLPAEKIMTAAAEAMKDKDRPKGSKRDLETLVYLARAAFEHAAAGTMEIDADDFELIRLFYPYGSKEDQG